MKNKIKENKNKFINLLLSTNREGIKDLVEFMENETDFFEAPASTKYHLSCEGGLLEHSLNVYNNLVKEISLDMLDESEEFKESMIIVSLLHDLCKANYYSVSEKNVKNEKGIWVKEPYYIVDDTFPLGHGEKSVILIQNFIYLTPLEILAIRWHMGGYEPKDNYTYLGKAFNKCYLALALHIADLKATYIDENEEIKKC